MLFLLVAYHVLQGALLKRRTKNETENEKKRKSGKYTCNIPVFFFIKRAKTGQKRFILYQLSYLTNGYYYMVVCFVRTSINHSNCFQIVMLKFEIKKEEMCVDIKKQLDGIPRRRRNKPFTH